MGDSTMRSRRRDRLFRSQRGSLAVEFIVVFPMFAALWLLGIYAFGFHLEKAVNQEEVRGCAWRYAVSGCTELPAGCPAPSGRSQVPDFELRGAAGGSFEKVGANLPFLDPTLSMLHGASFTMSQTEEIKRPTAFGGSVEVEATYKLMCNTPTREWNLTEVFNLECLLLGVPEWCL